MTSNIFKFRFFNQTIAFIAGTFLTLSFAPFNIFPLAILTPAILLLLWLPSSKRQAFWLGFWYGLGFFSTCIYWIFISIHTYGHVSVPIALTVTSLMIAFLSLYPAYTGYLLNRFFVNNNKTKILCAFPAIWVFLEWLRSLLFTGFPWGLLGYSQLSTPLKGYAPIFSVYGVSLATVLSGALLAYAFLQYRQKQNKYVYLSIVALLSIWIVGGALTFIHWTKPTNNPVKVSLVQGDIPQDTKWHPEHIQSTLDRYTSLTQSHWDSKIIVWPESAVPLPMHNAIDFLQALADDAKKHNTTIITGLPIKAENQDAYYNGIITLGDGEGVYAKRHLVPFGEYIPMKDTLGQLLDLFQVPMSNFIPGKISKPLLVNGSKIASFVCYEIAYPELVLFRDPSIGMLLTISDDAWFGHSIAPAQHLQIAQMRALELGRPILFAANNGITAIINSMGKIQSAVPQFKSTVLTDEVKPYKGQTPWQRWAMDPILGILVWMLYIAFRKRKTLA